MASVMQMNWPAMTPDQYEAVRTAMDVDNELPDGAISHVAWFDNVGLRAIDVWESPEHFDAFGESRMMPAVREAGIEGDPVIEWADAHHHFIAAT